MNRLSLDRRAAIIRALVDGNSVRATGRICGAAKGTILSLLADVGEACFAYQHVKHVNLKCERVQIDEIWSFVGAKEKNVLPEKKLSQSWGDAWTWVAIDADTKLVPMWAVAPRHWEVRRVSWRILLRAWRAASSLPPMALCSTNKP